MFLVYWLGTYTYRLLCATLKVRHVSEGGREFILREKGIIGAIWHQRLFCAPHILRDVPNLAFMVSQSKDGEMIRYVLEGLGYKAIQGSSSRRGSAAFREMERHVAGGGVMGITPDGPRGPARRVQTGAPRLAVDMGLPFLTGGIAPRDCWIVPSWDRFLFPKPFTEVVFYWGKPIFVEKGGGPEEIERLQGQLERELNRVTDEADRAVGRKPRPRGKTERR